jgi:hypothetical protein
MIYKSELTISEIVTESTILSGQANITTDEEASGSSVEAQKEIVSEIHINESADEVGPVESK